MNRLFIVETLESRTLFAGVTILATGRNGGIPGWMQTTADEITTKLGGPSNVAQYILLVGADPTTGALVPSIRHVDGTATPQTNSTGEIIVFTDYQSISADAIYSSTQIGAVFADFLINTPVDGIKLASLPIHEIGVSRGTAIIEGISKELGQAGVWVDQETYLDPNPIYAQGDPPSAIYDNVAFVDNYWRNDGSQSQVNDGHPVNGAYNLNVYWLDADSAGYWTPHLAPAGYYDGTIDLNATQGGDGPIYSDWYGTTPTKPARTQTGFIYSSIIGAARPLSGVWAASGGTGARTATGQAGTQWGNVTDLTLTSGATVASGNSIQVAYLHQDRDSADTITFYLDTDRNPYNNAFAATLGSSNLAQANAITGGTNTLSTAGVAPGKYWLCAKITDAPGNTRYAYESVTAPLTVTTKPPPPVVNLPATITGRFFNDLNGNAILDAGEPGLAGVPVYVDLAGTGQYNASDPSATTDANGNYAIAGLTPGTPLTIRAIIPTGMRQTSAPSSPVTLLSGQTLAVADFSASQTAIITGAVSVKNVGITPSVSSPAGFKVILTQHLRHQRPRNFVTYANANGSFTFNGLQAGGIDTVRIFGRKGFRLAPHSRNAYLLKLHDGQVVSNLLFSQVPIVP